RLECVLVHLLTHEGILLKKLLIRGRLHNWIYRLIAGSNFVQGSERYDYRGRRKSPPSFYLRFTATIA
ncbi:hypothetical protein ACSZMI_17805, partial [Aeromonas veronii]